MKNRILNILAICIAVSFITAPFSQVYAQLPNPGMTIDLSNTALVITDPQNDFLSPEGVAWGVVGKNVTDNNTVANIPIGSKSLSSEANDVYIVSISASREGNTFASLDENQSQVIRKKVKKIGTEFG